VEPDQPSQSHASGDTSCRCQDRLRRELAGFPSLLQRVLPLRLGDIEPHLLHVHGHLVTPQVLFFLLAGVTASKRVDAKIRWYSRHMNILGVYGIYPPVAEGLDL
jgi:hypothetical protein